MKVTTAITTLLLAFTLYGKQPTHVTATWGGDTVKLMEVKTGKVWYETYDDFFRKCGGKEPSKLGVKVFGTLPKWYKGVGSKPPIDQKVKPKPQEKAVATDYSGLPQKVTDSDSSSDFLLPNVMPSSVSLVDACRSLWNKIPPMLGLNQQEIHPEPVKVKEEQVLSRQVATVGGIKVYSLLDTPPTAEEGEEADVEVESIETGSTSTTRTRITENYDIRKPAVITPYALDAVFEGELKGLGEVFIEEARANGICPLFLAGVAYHECYNGKSTMVKDKKNAFGLYRNGKPMAFKTVAESVKEAASWLGGGGYVKRGLHTIALIQPRYCPIGENDNGTNKYWRSGVVAGMKRFLGPTVYVTAL